MSAINKFWQARNLREKIILGGGGIILASMLIYAYVLNPMEIERKTMALRLPELQTTSAQMQDALNEVKKLRAIIPAEGANEGSVPATRNIIIKALTAGGMDAEQIEVLQSGNIKVSLKMISFDKYPAWLATLQSKHGIRLEACDLKVVGAPDMIDVTSTLMRP